MPEITPSQAPGYLTDEQAHFWAMGWNSHEEALRDDRDELLGALQIIAQNTQHTGSREIALAAIAKATGQ